MSTNYPASHDSYSTKVDGVTTVAAADVNNLQDAVVAIETQLDLAGMLTGSGVPAGGTGVNTNLYLDTASGIIYRKTAGTWAAIYTPSAGGGVEPAVVNGFKAWTMDPALISAGAGKQITAAGSLFLTRFVAMTSQTISTIAVCVGAAGTTSTCGVALYSAAGALLKQSTSNFSTTSTGVATGTLTSSQAIVAGTVYYCGVWSSTASGSAPTLVSSPTSGIGGSGNLSSSIGLSGQNLRSAKADTGLTTTAPANFTTLTSVDPAIWFGLA